MGKDQNATKRAILVLDEAYSRLIDDDLQGLWRCGVCKYGWHSEMDNIEHWEGCFAGRILEAKQGLETSRRSTAKHDGPKLFQITEADVGQFAFDRRYVEGMENENKRVREQIYDLYLASDKKLREAETSHRVEYWQGKKDGFRMAVILLDDPKSAKDLAQVQNTSRGARYSDAEHKALDAALEEGTQDVQSS